MSKRNEGILTLVLVCSFFLSCLLPGYVFGAGNSVEEKMKSLEETIKAMQHEITRLQDRHAIENLQGRYEAIHSTDEGLSWMLFANRPDTSKEITNEKIIGFDNIKAAYLKMGGMGGGTPSAAATTGGAPSVSASAGGFPSAGASAGSASSSMARAMSGGKFTVHPISTPVIEVAADGKTAKATFSSLGMEGDAWCFGKYANSYIKIDGQWYIWHMKWLRGFKTSYYTSWVDQKMEDIYEFTRERDKWGFPVVRTDINYDYLYAPGKKFKSITVPKPYETWTKEDEDGAWWKRDTTIP